MDWLQDITGGLDSLLHESVPSAVRNKLEMHWKKMTLQVSLQCTMNIVCHMKSFGISCQGARIVPVYVFDMSLLGGEVLFDQESSVSW